MTDSFRFVSKKLNNQSAFNLSMIVICCRNCCLGNCLCVLRLDSNV